MKGLVTAVAVCTSAFVVACTASIAQKSEMDRLDRIEAAEIKYDMAYLDRANDGEGGGSWLYDGRTVSCRISGNVDDPVLRCGPEGTEPPTH